MVSYLFSRAKINCRKEIEKKKEKELTCSEEAQLNPLAQLAGPAHHSFLSSSPGRRAHRCVAAMPWPPTPPRRPACLPVDTCVSRRSPWTSSSLSPSRHRLSRPLHGFPFPTEHRRGSSP